MTNNARFLLKLKDISKSFYGIQALNCVHFELEKGEVHALLGENGAGKTTLLNILTGAIQQDSGEILLNEKVVVIKNPASAKKLGIVKVHQELQLIPEITVGQNICLGNEPRIFSTGIINWKELHRQATDVLDLLEADFSSYEIVKNLSTAQMQITEIAKALREKSQILALDEPTSSLTSIEIDRLFKIIEKLKTSGTSIIYVSHRLDEVFLIADRLTVLRDGKYIGSYDVHSMNKKQLITLMVGRNIQNDMKSNFQKTIGEIVFEIKDFSISTDGKLNSFNLRKGEILGFAGLMGSGRTELMRKIFGADPKNQGVVLIENKKITIKNPSHAINQGIALIPEDRKRQGFVPILSNKSNVSLSSFKDLIKLGLIDHKKMKNNACDVINRLKVNPPDEEKLTRDLSGGNQQKIVLGKWLSKQYSIIIFDEPTRGIDVGAKAEIYQIIHKLASEGRSIIMVSSELTEILGISDRIIVMHEGNIVGEFNKEEATEELILQHAMGVTTEDGKSTQRIQHEDK